MKDKKIKRINIRISLNEYLYLKRLYKQHKNKYKSFSAYIRHLLVKAKELDDIELFTKAYNIGYDKGYNDAVGRLIKRT